MTSRQLLLFHFSFWFFLLFYSDALQWIGSDPDYHFSLARFGKIFYLTSLFFKIAVTYGFLWVLNLYFDRKAYLKLVLGLLGVILAYAGVRYLLEEMLTVYLWGVSNYNHSEKFTASFYITDSAYNTFYYFFNAVFLKMVVDYFKNEKIKNELKTEKISAELAFLKSQLNPHFLFNTINNIYTLTYQKSEKAPDAMLKLSEIMQYMLYESNEAFVDLEKEVRYLYNIIELQKMRYSDDVFLDVQLLGDFHNKKIAPLLLAPFVENAFKHGDLSDAGFPMHIYLFIKQENLHFVVENKKSKQNKDELGGVGLNNVKRRLELLYPDNHSLEITEDEDLYRSELNLILEN